MNQPLWGVGQTGSKSPWGLILLVGAIAAVGIYFWYADEHSAGSDEGFERWKEKSGEGWYVRAYRHGDRRPKEIYGPFGSKAEADARKAVEKGDDYWGRITVGKYATGEQALG